MGLWPPEFFCMLMRIILIGNSFTIALTRWLRAAHAKEKPRAGRGFRGWLGD